MLRLRLPASLFELRQDKTPGQVAMPIVFPVFRRTENGPAPFSLLPLVPGIYNPKPFCDADGR